MSNNPRYSNGSARRKVRARLKAEGRGCWICRAFGRPDAINYELPHGHPLAFEVDELKPVSRWREFGYASATACALDYSNLDATHRICNEWKGRMSVAEVMAIVKGNKQRATGQRATKPLPQPFDEW